MIKLLCFLATFLLLNNFASAQNLQNYKVPTIILNGENGIPIYTNNIPVKTMYGNEVSFSIKANSPMDFAFVVSDEGDDYYGWGLSTEYNLQVRTGNYYILVSFDKSITSNFFYYTNININSAEEIIIDKSEINEKKTMNLVQANGELLSFHDLTLFSLYRKSFDKGIVMIHFLYPTSFNSNYVVNYNIFPDSVITFGWSATGKATENNGNTYRLSGLFKNDRDSLIRNDATNLVHNNMYYYFPEMNIPTNVNVSVYFWPPNHFFLDDPNYSLPLHISLYQDKTSPQFLYFSYFYNSINIGRSDNDEIVTLPIVSGEEKVYGWLSGGTETLISLSEIPDVRLGLTPSFWYGKFYNEKDSIKIRSIWGLFIDTSLYNQLFLSQTNDAVPQFPVKLDIKNIESDSILYNNVSLSPQQTTSGYYIDRGYTADMLSYPVETGKYETTITNDKNEIAGMPSVVTAKAVCDLRKEDKNPPGLNSFQIVGGNSLSHTLKKGDVNIIRFFPVDDEGISEMELYYKEEAESEWHGLNISVLDEYYYQTVLPDLSMGTYSLKLVLSDATGNTMEMLQEPAFVYSVPDAVEEEGDLNPEKYDISAGYPNPFNMEVNFIYNIPGNSDGKIRIEIYNILGEKVRKLFDGEVSSGKHKIKWNGRNEENAIMPSGIYLLKFSSMEKSVVRKIILMK